MSRVLLVLSLLVSSLQAQTFSTFDGKGRAGGLTVAADGNIWFFREGGIGKITPLGEVTTIDTPVMLSSAMANGPNGTVYYTRYNGIDTINVFTGERISRDVPYMPQALAVTPDGSAWYAVDYPIGIGRLSPSGETAFFPVPAGARSMITGGDGNVWFTQPSLYGEIGRITADGTITYFRITPQACCGQMFASSAGGALWVTLQGDAIARLTFSGEIASVLRRPQSWAQGMAVGPDGRIWISTSLGFDIVSTDGHAESLAVPEARYGLGYVIAGPDGNVWASIVDPLVCAGICLPMEPAVAPRFLRVNLKNPEPRITRVSPTSSGVAIEGLGFVPDTVIHFDGIERTTRYLSPFTIALDLPDAINGGTFIATNNAPGGGESAEFVYRPAAAPRHRAAH